MLMIHTEEGEAAFMRALDHTKIENWEHFEYLLSFIIENRLLRIYQAHLQSQQQCYDIEDCEEAQDAKKK